MRFLQGVAAFGVCVAVAAAGPAQAADRDLIILNIGQSDIGDSDEETVEASIEYSSRRAYWGNGSWFGGAGPLLGLMVTGKGAVFGYAGVYGDFFLGNSFVVRPEVGVGAFAPGDGKDLGGAFEIHASLTAAYVFGNQARLGVTLSHISNAGTHDSNPAVESLLLTYAFPIGPLF